MVPIGSVGKFDKDSLISDFSKDILVKLGFYSAALVCVKTAAFCKSF